MRKYRSRTRMAYGNAYRHLRVGHRPEPGGIWDLIPQETIDCAILTYDYYDSEFSGWMDRQRMRKFYDLAIKRFPKHWIPF